MHAMRVGVRVGVDVLDGRLWRRVDAMPVVYSTLLIVDKYFIGSVDLPKLFLGLEFALRWGSVGMCLERALLVGSTDIVRTRVVVQLESLV